jgi:rare lipoprotein A
MGTCVRVTRLPSGRSVIVRINDRGPFVAGRVIDVSRRAADWLEMLEAGVVRVRVEIIPSGHPPGG